jgi:PAS domain S-box-containing protein
MLDKDKNDIPVEIIGRLLLNDKGLPIGLQGSTRDISERKIVEQELQKSEEKYRNYIDNAPNGVFVVDLKGNYISVNKAGADMAGYTQKELLEMNVRDLSNDKGNSQAFLELLETGHIAKQLSHIKKDGTIAWWYLNAVKLNNDKVIGFTIDMTDKVKAETELQNSEHKLSTLFENMNEGFALHKIITDKNGKPIDYIYLDMNPAFEKMTGLKKSQTIGKKVSELLPEIKNDPINWVERYGKVAQENITIRFEDYSHPLKKWFFVSAFSPQKDQFATTIHDITERKKTETELIKLKNELEEKVQIQTKDLNEKIIELERFHDATINREYRIKELNDELKALKGKNK